LTKPSNRSIRRFAVILGKKVNQFAEYIYPMSAGTVNVDRKQATAIAGTSGSYFLPYIDVQVDAVWVNGTSLPSVLTITSASVTRTITAVPTGVGLCGT
jgi:hypothetical protein